MTQWPQNPTWQDASNINKGNQYSDADGVTVTDMNNIINNLLYLKKYGGKVNVLVLDAKVEGTKLIVSSKEV